jgi:hypothetical protein
MSWRDYSVGTDNIKKFEKRKGNLVFLPPAFFKHV